MVIPSLSSDSLSLAVEQYTAVLKPPNCHKDAKERSKNKENTK